MDEIRLSEHGIPEMDAQTARKYIAGNSDNADFVLLDVRTAEEIEEAHVAGVLRLDFLSGEFHDRMPQLDTRKDYLVVCRSGNRSGQAVGLMLQAGFRKAVNMEGGMLAWRQLGYPIESGDVEAL